MANMLINTSQTKALRLTEINAVLVEPDVQAEEPTVYKVVLRTSWLAGIIFETADSLAGAQSKALPIIQALNA